MKIYFVALFLFCSLFVMAQSDDQTKKKEIIINHLLGKQYVDNSKLFFDGLFLYAQFQYPELTDSLKDEIQYNLDGNRIYLNAYAEYFSTKFTLEELLLLQNIFNNPLVIRFKDAEHSINNSIPEIAEKCQSSFLKQVEDYLFKIKNN